MGDCSHVQRIVKHVILYISITYGLSLGKKMFLESKVVATFFLKNQHKFVVKH